MFVFSSTESVFTKAFFAIRVEDEDVHSEVEELLSRLIIFLHLLMNCQLHFLVYHLQPLLAFKRPDLDQ
jgi:hypothetical protein